MNAMRSTLLICLLASTPLFTGCGKEAHREAVALCQVLEKHQPDYNTANGMERDLVVSTRGWTDTIMANGAGKGAEIAQNAGVAKELAHSADVISTSLGELRKAVYDQPLQKEELQAVRTTINAQISKRQKFLSEMRTVLTDTAAQFEALGQSRAYKGDSYPAGIDKLNQLLQSYHSPEDAVRQAVESLKADYGISGAAGGV
jgi:ABC-type transporter Mla subunit MlaD